MEGKRKLSVFGIFGSGLFARSGRGTETVTLLDDRGCPVEPSIFPALQRSSDSKSLVAPFQAFKFASESTVKFQLTVSFCLDECAPVQCEDDSTKEVKTSFGRRRRSSEGSGGKSLELQTGDVVTDITMETPLFMVSSGRQTLRPSATDRTANAPEVAVPAEKGLCLTRPILYTVAIVGSLAQVAFFLCCVLIFLFVRRVARHRSGRLSSGCSVSSKQELCAS